MNYSIIYYKKNTRGVKELNEIYFFNNEQVFLRASEFTRVTGFRGKFDLSTAFVLNIEDKKIRQLLIPGKKILAGQTGLGNVVGVTSDGQYALMPAFSPVDNHFPKPVYSLYKVSLQRNFLKSSEAGDLNTEDFFVNREGEAIAKEEHDDRNNEHKIIDYEDGFTKKGGVVLKEMETGVRLRMVKILKKKK